MTHLRYLVSIFCAHSDMFVLYEVIKQVKTTQFRVKVKSFPT